MADSCDPMNCSWPGSSAHRILQARILEWVIFSFSKGSSQPRNQTQVSSIAGRLYTDWAMRETLKLFYYWSSESYSVVSDSFWPHGLYRPYGTLQARILEWVAILSPGDLPNPGIEFRSPPLQVDSLPAYRLGKLKNTGVGVLFLLQGIFLIQESIQGLLHCRQFFTSWATRETVFVCYILKWKVLWKGLHVYFEAKLRILVK